MREGTFNYLWKKAFHRLNMITCYKPRGMFTSTFCNWGQGDKQSNDQTSRISFFFWSHNLSTWAVVNEAYFQLLALNYLHLFLRKISGHVQEFIRVQEGENSEDSEQGPHRSPGASVRFRGGGAVMEAQPGPYGIVSSEKEKEFWS